MKTNSIVAFLFSLLFITLAGTGCVNLSANGPRGTMVVCMDEGGKVVPAKVFLSGIQVSTGEPYVGLFDPRVEYYPLRFECEGYESLEVKLAPKFVWGKGLTLIVAKAGTVVVSPVWTVAEFAGHFASEETFKSIRPRVIVKMKKVSGSAAVGRHASSITPQVAVPHVPTPIRHAPATTVLQ
mgnify:CR=1 FL=1